MPKWEPARWLRRRCFDSGPGLARRLTVECVRAMCHRPRLWESAALLTSQQLPRARPPAARRTRSRSSQPLACPCPWGHISGLRCPAHTRQAQPTPGQAPACSQGATQGGRSGDLTQRASRGGCVCEAFRQAMGVRGWKRLAPAEGVPKTSAGPLGQAQ